MVPAAVDNKEGRVNQSLGEALPAEIARIRDVVIPAYLEIGSAGLPAVTLMRRDLDLASKAMIEGDLPAMIHIYEELKGWQL